MTVSSFSYCCRFTFFGYDCKSWFVGSVIKSMKKCTYELRNFWKHGYHSLKPFFHVWKCKKDVFSYYTVILLCKNCKLLSNTHVPHTISTSRHQSQLQKGLQKMYFRNENRKEGEIIKKSLLAMHRRLLLNSANTIMLLKIANKG